MHCKFDRSHSRILPACLHSSSTCRAFSLLQVSGYRCPGHRRCSKWAMSGLKIAPVSTDCTDISPKRVGCRAPLFYFRAKLAPQPERCRVTLGCIRTAENEENRQIPANEKARRGGRGGRPFGTWLKGRTTLGLQKERLTGPEVPKPRLTSLLPSPSDHDDATRCAGKDCARTKQWQSAFTNCSPSARTIHIAQCIECASSATPGGLHNLPPAGALRSLFGP